MSGPGSPKERPRGFRAVWLALRNRRTAAVALLSFSSGMPLGMVWIAIPVWLAREGVDIKAIGLFTLFQAPWSFKFLWSPLMDRYAPPLPRMGRKLAWTLVWQLGLLLLTLALGGVRPGTDFLWMAGALSLAVAFASASQDIAIDAYAVEILRPEEQGVAVGARIAVYRAAMFVAGGLAITMAGWTSWPVVFVVLAVLYVPMMVVATFAPRPETDAIPAPRTLRAAVWEPFVGFLSVHRSLEILTFVLLYKLCDNLVLALVRPFLVQKGYNDFDVGIATATIGLVATLAGTFLGGALTTAMGLGHALWAFGALQIVSTLGYVAVDQLGINRPVMYAAMGLESFTTSMATGAFSVLLLRLTQKRFSATQYALFSSLFALPRLLAGPAAGVMADAIGWTGFFLIAMAFGIPGLVMLQRFCPIGVRDPVFEIREPRAARPFSRGEILARALLGGAIGIAIGVLVAGLVPALKAFHKDPSRGVDLAGPLLALLPPGTVKGWIQIAGIAAFGLVVALVSAAMAAARSGHRPRD